MLQIRLLSKQSGTASPLRFSWAIKLTSALVATSIASSAYARSASPIHVIFFGGYGSTTAQMKSWASAATDIINGNHGKFDITAAPINSAHSDKAGVVADNTATIAAWVKKISQTPNEDFMLVGHSSGSAISNAIALQVKARSVPLIVLDGFIPSSALQANAECWSSVDLKDSRKTSLNTSAMRSCKFYREIKVSGCLNSMCLHFALVNRSAPAVGVTSSNYKSSGYLEVNPFLDWL